MSKSGTIIIVDDNKGVLTALQILLKNYFSKVVTLSSPVALSSVIREEVPEVILLDMNFTSADVDDFSTILSVIQRPFGIAILHIIKQLTHNAL